MRLSRRIVGGAVVAALAALLVTAAPALGASPGGNGRLVTTFNDANGGSLVTMDADGTDRSTIPTPGIDSPALPKWSPDGQRIAFTDNGGTLFVADADGSDLTMVASGVGSHTWSPDGTRLAFQDGAELVAQNVATGVRQTLATLPGVTAAGEDYSTAASPDWSPDGARIVFTSGTSDAINGDLFALDVTSGQVVRVTHSPLYTDTYTGGNSEADWTGTGSRVYFTCAIFKYTGDLCRVAPDGSNLQLLTDAVPPTPDPGGLTSGPDYRSPASSPDGTKLANTHFEFLAGVPVSTLQVRNADGSAPVTIATNADGRWYYLDWQPIPGGGNPDVDGDGVANSIDTGAGRSVTTTRRPPPVPSSTTLASPSR